MMDINVVTYFIMTPGTTSWIFCFIVLSSSYGPHASSPRLCKWQPVSMFSQLSGLQYATASEYKLVSPSGDCNKGNDIICFHGPMLSSSYCTQNATVATIITCVPVASSYGNAPNLSLHLLFFLLFIFKTHNTRHILARKISVSI